MKQEPAVFAQDLTIPSNATVSFPDTYVPTSGSFFQRSSAKPLITSTIAKQAGGLDVGDARREVAPTVRLVTSRAVFSQICSKTCRDVTPMLPVITSHRENENKPKS